MLARKKKTRAVKSNNSSFPTSNQPRCGFDVGSAARTLDGRIHTPLWYTLRTGHSNNVVLFRTYTQVLQSLRV